MRPDVLPADQLFGADLSSYGRRLLAEGDSWFTLGTLNLAVNGNLLMSQSLGTRTVIVSCAYPGDTLQQMAEGARDRDFDRLLRQPGYARYWEAILLSAGGNDLIAAAEHRPVWQDGTPAAWSHRLMLTPAEAAQQHAGVSGPQRYISEPGWAALAAYLRAGLADIVQRRDQGASAGRPLVLHTYAAPVVRPAGVLGNGGWLWPAMTAYGIPVSERQGLSDELFGRLRQLWLDVATTLPHVHVFDSAALTTLVPAAPGSTGNSGDWSNEIHLNRSGYDKVGAVMGPWLEQLLAGYP
ncbi:MAG: hypothetical protein J0M20_15015 [Burkholderiales bacterium]|nr:hypothetical protein [Burkholderiales bacterium]